MDSKRLHFILWHRLCHTRLKTPIFALVWHTIEDETAQNHARPSANPSRAHDHVRTAPGTGQSQQDGATTTSTDARRRPTRPMSWSYGRTNTRCSRRLLRPERPLMNPPNLTSPLPGLASPAGRQRANHNDLPGIRLHGHIPAVADADPVQIRGKAR